MPISGDPPRLWGIVDADALSSQGMPKGACAEGYLLGHPQIMHNLICGLHGAGCSVLCVPTGGANRMSMAALDIFEDVAGYNRRLIELAQKSAGHTPLCGMISCSCVESEPFSDDLFLELCGSCAEQAAALAKAGVQYLLCYDMQSLTQARAAVLGARESGLPVYVTTAANHMGETKLGSSILSMLVSVQSLGASGFGLSSLDGNDVLAGLLQQLAPYADVPLLALPFSPSGVSVPASGAPGAGAVELLRSGASALGGSVESALKQWKGLLDPFDFSRVTAEKADAPILAACDSAVFELQEDLEFTEAVSCESEMGDILLAAENSSAVLLVRVDSADDARSFSMNAHMARVPVAFLSDSAEALELALAFYNGRAIVSSMSELPHPVLERLCQAFGAVLV